jgi:hypothetical protein
MIDVVMLQTLARKDNIESLTSGYGLVVADECHHIPAAAFEHAVKQIPARRWLGLTATPYRRDKLDDLIALQLGPIRHIITHSAQDASAVDDRSPQLELLQPCPPRPTPVLHVHETGFRYTGEANPSVPGGMAAIYRDLVADDARATQVIIDVTAALERGRHCLVLTQWTAHVERFAEQLRQRGLDPVVLRGGMSGKARRTALARLQPLTDGSPLLAVATDRSSARDSTARRWTPCSSRRQSPSRDVLCSTWAESCARIRERRPPRYTTTTTSTPESWRPPWPSARRATQALASPTPASRHHGVDQLAQGVRCLGNAYPSALASSGRRTTRSRSP